MNKTFCSDGSERNGGIKPINNIPRPKVIPPPQKPMKVKMPESINIMGVPIKIVYLKNAIDVDPAQKEATLGAADFLKQEIRVWDGGSPEITWQTIFHEVLHIIGDIAKLKLLRVDSFDKHNELDCLANVLADTLIRNKLLNIH